ncbi:MAG: bifunctional DNA primase/polymerase [Verrucomicrobiae bacterium]|nr:bifunctional DNA primase/polymerase [Verrucomicrobiae bacterium]
MNPDEILNRLGVRAVLLRIKPGTKQPSRSRWQEFTFETTRTPSYQTKLRRAAAIGVLLGSASEGLCSIDFDDDEFKERFFEVNQFLRGSLTTTARRGANVWLVIEGELPPSKKLRFEGQPVGELRSNGNQTLIAGRHPEGMEYRRIVDAPPTRIRWDDIRWPEGTEGLEGVVCPSHLSPSSPNSQPSPSLYPLPLLHPLHNIKERIEGAEQARSRLAQNPTLHKLYQRFVGKKFTPRQGARNSDLVTMVTFLYKAVGHERLIELVTAFHQVNQDLFIDPLAMHMREAEAHLAACQNLWFESLSPREREIAETVPNDHAEAFRICRDLAFLDDDEMPQGRFFISCGDLADRLSLDHPPQARRILQVFESLGILEVVEKGTRHTKGSAGRATRYRWLLAPEPPPYPAALPEDGGS